MKAQILYTAVYYCSKFIFSDLPKKTLPIRQDGIVVSFEYITLFSNVLEVRILATNETPFPRHEVVMDFSVPTVSFLCYFCLFKVLVTVSIKETLYLQYHP